MQTRLARFIECLGQATTRSTLQSAVHDLRDEFGVAHLVYHSVNNTGQQYAALTYPEAWARRYVDEGYARIDPVIQGCLRRFHPVDWKRLDWSGRSARAFLAEALEAGVGNQGLSMPVRGPNGQFAMVTVSDRTSDADWARFADAHLHDLILMAHLINQKALEIEHGSDVRAFEALSPREVDVLTRLAMGLNRSQAAASLNISEHTLRAYVESARMKLKAANTTQAVARAIAEGLVLL